MQLPTSKLPTWSLPFIAIILVAPISLTFVYLGPIFGFIVALVILLLIVFLSVWFRPDQIFIADKLPGREQEALMVVLQQAEPEKIIKLLRESKTSSQRLSIVIPLQINSLEQLTGDIDEQRQKSRDYLHNLTNCLSSSEFHPARTQVGTKEVSLAIADALKVDYAEEVIIIGSLVEKSKQKLERQLPVKLKVLPIK